MRLGMGGEFKKHKYTVLIHQHQAGRGDTFEFFAIIFDWLDIILACAEQG